MRRQSSALVTATDKNSAIGVLFDVDHDVIVRKRCFQRGITLKFLKYFKNFFYYNFWATPWSNDFLLTNKNGFQDLFFILNSGGKSISHNIFCCLF